MKNFIRDEQGQDLIEYTLLIAFVALGAAAVMGSLGGGISNIFSSASSTLAGAVTSTASSTSGS